KNIQGAGGQRRRARIKTWRKGCFIGGRQRDGFHQRNAQALLAAQQQGQRCAGQATTNNQHIGVIVHALRFCFMVFSMSATSLGTSLVKTSWPVRVTATSSSMRIPIPRHLAATVSSSSAT